MSAQGTCGHLKPDTLVNQSSLVFPQGNLVYDIVGNMRKRTERKKLRGREAVNWGENMQEINLTIRHSEEKLIHKVHS